MIPLLTAVLILATPAADSSTQPRPKLAVMPLAAKHLPQATVDILDELLAADLDAAGRYQVLGIGDINAMLGLERMRDAAGCDDISCAAEIGGALGVQLLLTGSAGVLGDELLVQLTLIDTQAGKVVKRARGVVANDEKLYRRCVQLATADLLGTALATPPTPVATATTVAAQPSPARFRFDTVEKEFAFTVEVATMDGATHRCDQPVRRSSACLLANLAVGEAHLSVTAEDLNPFSDDFSVRDSDELYAIEVNSRASAGNVVAWSLGGVGMAAGTALVAVGLPTDKGGLVAGGIPTFIVGTGVLILGFFFDGDVDVNYPGIDAFF